jgi:ribosomal protein L40E
MAKKTLGHVELEWTCPSCGTRNPGRAQGCTSCGAPMPAGLRFQVGAGKPLDTSEATADRVAQGPDIHCPYCGVRNAGAAKTCRGCGGDLSEGERRAAGTVLGAFLSGPVADVTCPHCGAKNPGTRTACAQCGGALPRPVTEPPAEEAGASIETGKSKRLPLLAVLLAVVLACGGGWLLMRSLGRSSTTTGTVAAVEWTYTIAMEQLGPAEYEAWRDEIPDGARLGECSSRVRQTVDEPVPGATEECGTPYVVDTGTGQGRVMQDCQYHVPDAWCRYTVQEWIPAGEEETSGRDLSPYWPAVAVSTGRREGSRSEDYRVAFDTGDGQAAYRPATLDEFTRFVPGSRWQLEVNRIGTVLSAEPSP